MYAIVYHSKAVEVDIPKLDSKARQTIKNAIEKKLSTSPFLYGKPLRQSLVGYRKLRVGDYRVIFKIKEKSVIIFLIGHRSLIYSQAEKRIQKRS